MRECNDGFTSTRAPGVTLTNCERESFQPYASEITSGNRIADTSCAITPVIIPFCGFSSRVTNYTASESANESSKLCVPVANVLCVNEGHRYLSSLKYVEVLRNLPVRSLSLVLIGIVSKLLRYIMERSVTNDLTNFYFIVGYINIK